MSKFSSFSERKQFMEENKHRLFWYKVMMGILMLPIISSVAITLQFMADPPNTLKYQAVLPMIVLIYNVACIILAYRFSKKFLYLFYSVAGLISVWSILMSFYVAYETLLSSESITMAVLTLILVGLALCSYSVPILLICKYLYSIRDLFS